MAGRVYCCDNGVIITWKGRLEGRASSRRYAALSCILLVENLETNVAFCDMDVQQPILNRYNTTVSIRIVVACDMDTSFLFQKNRVVIPPLPNEYSM